MTDRIGQRLGNYQLTRFLGEGGFAEVYLGEHIHLGTPAALKVLKAQFTGSQIQQFEQEARTIATLKHPHIIQLFDYSLQQGTPFLVMEYAAHGTLRQRHPHGTRLPLPTIVSYVSQIAAALQVAHNAHIIHRDVKPQNVLLDQQHEVLLSDFGIAVVLQQTTSHETIPGFGGTPVYAAPEQFMGQIGAASDQYALGVMVYEWLIGEVPFGGLAYAIGHQKQTQKPPALRAKDPAIPQAVEDVVMRSLAIDPKARFATISSFAQSLEHACEISSLHPGITPPTRQPQVLQHHIISRRAVLAGLTVAGGLAVGVSLALPAIARNFSLFASSVPVYSPGHTFSIYRGHTATVWKVAWSHQDTRIASASGMHALDGSKIDASVHLWDTSDGGHPLIYTGHTDEVYGVAWSPDDHRIASGGNDTTVQIWEATSGQPAAVTYRGHTSVVKSVAWSYDGMLIASASFDGTARVWEIATLLEHFHSSDYQAWVFCVIWSPDHRHIVYGGGEHPSLSLDNTTIHLVDLTTGADKVVYSGHTAAVTSMAWSPDGTRIASGSEDASVHVWELSTGKRVFTCLGHTDIVTDVAWSPDGKQIASSSWDQTARIWEADSGLSQYTFHGHANRVQTVAWSHDSTRVVSGSWDMTVQVWQAQ